MSLRRTNRRWEELARSDPLWAIASDPSKRGRGWDLDEFFASGKGSLAEVVERLKRLGLSPPSGRALDFGCGVGRLSQALAKFADRVDGVDAAPTMIDNARELDRSQGRCHFRLVTEPPLPFADGEFDFVLSLVTLQHIPPAPARLYLAELVRILGPNGIMVVQLAAEPIVAISGARAWVRRMIPKSALEAWRNLRNQLWPPESFEMHGLMSCEVRRLVEAAGGEILEAAEDRMAGEGWRSFIYVICRSSAPIST